MRFRYFTQYNCEYSYVNGLVPSLIKTLDYVIEYASLCHANVFLVIHFFIHDWWSCVIYNLTMNVISKHTPCSLVHVWYASRLQKASFPCNLPKELISVLECTNSIKLEKLVVLDSIYKGFDWSHRVLEIFDSDSRPQNERISLFRCRENNTWGVYQHNIFI